MFQDGRPFEKEKRVEIIKKKSSCTEQKDQVWTRYCRKQVGRTEKPSQLRGDGFPQPGDESGLQRWLRLLGRWLFLRPRATDSQGVFDCAAPVLSGGNEAPK